MRVLVLANCSHPAYTAWLQQVFPNWDVRSVFLPQAQDWVRDGHAPFLDFLDRLDLFVGMTDQTPVAARVARRSGGCPCPIWCFRATIPIPSGCTVSPRRWGPG